MKRVVVVGAGLAGCGAAIAARKAGAQVTLVERTDAVAGVAVRAGETNGNGWSTGQHELRALGGGEIFDALASITLHSHVAFPDVALHAYLYNAGRIEPTMRRLLEGAGVKLLLPGRVTGVVKEESRIRAVKLEDGRLVEGDVFVDCTGTRGGMAVCHRYGKGCVMCLLRCPAFGDRAGVVDLAGGQVRNRWRPDGTPGRLCGGIFLFKDTVAPDLMKRVEEEGLVRVPLPQHLVDYSSVGMLAGGRGREFAESVVLTDIGPVVKLSAVGPTGLERLRQVPGLENAQVEDPRSTRWNHVSDIGIADRDISLKVKGFANLFCAGEKSGQTSIDGAVITGYLAGHNAVRHAAGVAPLVLPATLAIGDLMEVVTRGLETGEVLKDGCRMSRGHYWERMQKLGLYTGDVGKIRARVEEAGLTGVLSHALAS